MPKRNYKFIIPLELRYKGEYSCLNPVVHKMYQELRKKGFGKPRNRNN